MLIREIVEKVNQGEVNLKKIAETLEGVTEKNLRYALKKAGYEYRNSGKKGWYFIGEGEEPLEKHIGEFVEKKSNGNNKRANERKNENTKVVKNFVTKEEKNVVTNEQTNVRTKEEKNVVRKRASFDIDVELLKELKIQAVLRDKNVYEMVEQAIRKYLSEEK